MTKTKKSKLPVFIVSLALLAVAAAVTIYLSQSINSNPVFSFDDSAAPGWWSSGNLTPQDNIDPDQYDEVASGPINQLPVADILINHGGPDDKPTDDRCFVSLSYYDYPLASIAQAYSEFEQRINQSGWFEHIDSIDQTITTHQGDKPYQLRLYRTGVDGSRQGQYMSGNQIGYVALDSGHIRINGVCQTPEQLDLTLAPLAAVQLTLP